MQSAIIPQYVVPMSLRLAVCLSTCDIQVS